MSKESQDLATHVEICAIRYEGIQQRFAAIDARLEHECAWMEHVQQVADGTLYPRANSWYVGANVPGKPRRFMPYLGGLGVYRAKCDAIAEAGYLGFDFS